VVLSAGGLEKEWNWRMVCMVRDYMRVSSKRRSNFVLSLTGVPTSAVDSSVTTLILTATNDVVNCTECNAEVRPWGPEHQVLHRCSECQIHAWCDKCFAIRPPKHTPQLCHDNAIRLLNAKSFLKVEERTCAYCNHDEDQIGNGIVKRVKDSFGKSINRRFAADCKDRADPIDEDTSGIDLEQAAAWAEFHKCKQRMGGGGFTENYYTRKRTDGRWEVTFEKSDSNVVTSTSIYRRDQTKQTYPASGSVINIAEKASYWVKWSSIWIPKALDVVMEYVGTTMLLTCQPCGRALYCSKSCQSKDWKERHKSECNRIRHLAPFPE
jgi:hypothetical protein